MTTQSGDLDVEASETASITATAAAAASAVSGGSAISAAFSTAGVSSTNTITSQVSAFIASSTDVEAAGAVQVSAGNAPTVTAEIVATSISAGFFGIAFGLSQAQDSEGGMVSAYIDGSTVQANGGNPASNPPIPAIAVLANSNPSITTNNAVTAITVALAGASAAGAESNLTIDTITQAYVNNATLTAPASGSEVLVQAASTSTAAPTVDSSAVGGTVALAQVSSVATIDGTTEAYASGTTTATTTAFDIDATANNTATSDSEYTAVGAIAVGTLTQTATDTPTVQAYIGANSKMQNSQSITVNAESSDDVTAKEAGAAAGLVAAGVDNVTAKMTPTVSAFIDSGATVTSTSGAVTVEATEEPTSKVQASGTAVGVSLAGGEATTIMATAGAKVTSDIGSGATVSAPGIVTVAATGTNLVTATANTFSIGIVANVAFITATATDNGVDSAYVGRPAGTTGAGAVVGTAAQQDGGLDVQATGSDSSTADVNLSGGGIFSDSGGSSTSTTTPTLNACVSSGSMVNVTGNVTVQSTSTTGGNATSNGASGGIVDVSASKATTTVTPTINTYIASSGGASALEVSPQDISNSIITLANNFSNGEGVGYSLAPGASAIVGLTPGTTYYVINATATSFQLAAKSGGGALALNATNATVGQFFAPGATIVAGGSITVNSNYGAPPAPVSDGSFTPSEVSNNAINFPLNIGLVTGSTVTYDQNGNSASLGLTDGRLYPVIAVSSSTVEFGVTFDAATAVNDYDAPANVTNDTITIPNADDLQTGDEVVYDPNGGTPIGGLTPGATYQVIVINSDTIKLANLGTLPTPTSFNPSTTVSNNTINLSGFSDGQAVTYNAPAPLEVVAGEINNTKAKDANSIYLGDDSKGKPIPDGFNNGDAVVYSLASGTTAIGGLTSGTTYYVIAVASNEFQLSATPPVSGTNGSPITLTTTNTTGDQLFTPVDDQPIGGLVSGNTYYVINDTGSSFQLAKTPTGSATRPERHRPHRDVYDRHGRDRLHVGGFRHPGPGLPVDPGWCQRDVPPRGRGRRRRPAERLVRLRRGGRECDQLGRRRGQRRRCDGHSHLVPDRQHVGGRQYEPDGQWRHHHHVHVLCQRFRGWQQQRRRLCRGGQWERHDQPRQHQQCDRRQRGHHQHARRQFHPPGHVLP